MSFASWYDASSYRAQEGRSDAAVYSRLSKPPVEFGWLAGSQAEGIPPMAHAQRVSVPQAEVGLAKIHRRLGPRPGPGRASVLGMTCRRRLLHPCLLSLSSCARDTDA